MKRTSIIYWILTGLFAFMMLGSAIPDIFSVPMAVQGFKEIGMPAYLLPFLGIAKTLGVIAILIPGYPRIKEWAYAGLMYDLFGGMYSIANSGKSPSQWAPMILIITLGFCAYIWYHKRKTGIAARNDFDTRNLLNNKEYEKAETANAIIA